VGGYSFATPFVYASFLIYVWIGSRLRSTQNPLAFAPRRSRQRAVFPDYQFCDVAEAGVPLYAQRRRPDGLLCGGDSIYGRTLLADLFYSAALFGAYALLSRRVAANQPAA